MVLCSSVRDSGGGDATGGATDRPTDAGIHPAADGPASLKKDLGVGSGSGSSGSQQLASSSALTDRNSSQAGGQPNFSLKHLNEVLCKP